MLNCIPFPTIFVFALIGVVDSQKTAQCELMVNPVLDDAVKQPLQGTITLTQQEEHGPISLNLNVTGFNTSDSQTKHGFHVHKTSDFTNGCQSTGGHFNPTNVDHGGPDSNIRHVGDLGNIEEDENGDVNTTIVDDVIDFSGDNNVLHRSLIIHDMEDDLGLAGTEASKKTGTSGARLACCAITEMINSSAINGGGSTGNGDGSTGNGDGSTSTGGGSTGNGGGSTGNGDDSTGNGDGSTSNGDGSTSNGDGSTGNGDGSTGSGDGSTSNGGGSTGNGDGSTSNGGGSTSNGDGSTNNGDGSSGGNSNTGGSNGCGSSFVNIQMLVLAAAILVWAAQ